MVNQASHTPVLFRRIALVAFVMTATVVGVLSSTIQSASAQNNTVPAQTYYPVINLLHQGEFRSAKAIVDGFQGRLVYQGDVQVRFLDAVCYRTMYGESCYRLGEYDLALEQFESALSLYVSIQGFFQQRTNFPREILDDQEATRNAQVPWATSTRTPRYGAYGSMNVRLGKTPQENEFAARNGGVIDPEVLLPVNITEVMRCVSLAMYRRQMIKGPIATIDPLTRQLSTNLIGTGGATVRGSWSGIAKGLSYMSQGDLQRAVPLLSGSLQIGGKDHPLTATALLALGKIAINQNRLSDASTLFLEASIAAAAYDQYDLVEEALRYGAIIHASGRTLKPYEPLVAAIAWARNRDTLKASLLTTAAMLAAESADADAAAKLLGDARREMSGNDISRSNIQTRWQYVNAMVSHLKQDQKRGDENFQRYLAAAGNTSLWLYQIALADNAIRANVMSERQSENLYDMLLREPTDFDWKFRPEETMAFLMTPHYEPMERWFTVALSRKADEKAIGIAELIRRHRFFSTLPMGGRMLSLRWTLEAPNSTLSEKSRQQKQALLTQYPDYKPLSDEAANLRQQLDDLPISPDPKSPEGVKQKQLMASLAGAVGRQEKFLRSIALVRDPCELAFPKPMTIAEIQQRLEPGQVVVTILRAGQLYYVMKLGGGSYTIESQIQARVLDNKILKLIKALNVGDKATVLDPEVFEDEKWRAIAHEISQLIFAKTQPQAIDSMNEIVFVPDGKTWYLPMEVLQVGAAGSTTNLSDKVRVRYAPTAALAVPDERVPKRFRRAGVVVDRNFIKDDANRMAQGLKDLQASIPEMEQIEKTMQGVSALVGSTVDQLVVWHMSSEKANGNFGFAPFQLDSGKPGSTLESWMLLPWRGVDQMILSGVSSAIEGSGRSRANGSELFLSSMGLMASGTRTILISRWRVGGQTTLDLTREFALELGKQSATRAWKRSVDLLKDSEIDNTAEPRLREKVLDQPMTGKHPYFWAGYMLLDSGYQPKTEEAEPPAEAGK